MRLRRTLLAAALALASMHFKKRQEAKAAPAPCDTELGSLDLSRDVVPPRKVKDAPPVYPESAKTGPGGKVVLEFTITPAGKTADVRVKQGADATLDQAALDAVRQWEYTPSLVRGKPCPTITTVTVQFLAATPPPAVARRP